MSQNATPCLKPNTNLKLSPHLDLSLYLKSQCLYAPIHEQIRSKHLNKMETFFVSESLKYLLMIFSEENPFPFDRYVFNTEAHAFPIL